jgi:hypothetical protein
MGRWLETDPSVLALLAPIGFVSTSVVSGKRLRLVDVYGKAALLRLLKLGLDILLSKLCKFASDDSPEVDITEVSASKVSPLSPSSTGLSSTG